VLAPGEHARLYGTVRPRRDGKQMHLLRDGPGGGTHFHGTDKSFSAKVQRLPDGRRTFGYVVRITGTDFGRYRFKAEADVDPDDDYRLAGGYSDPVTMWVRE
jgi:hypothetical protein